MEIFIGLALQVSLADCCGAPSGLSRSGNGRHLMLTAVNTSDDAAPRICHVDEVGVGGNSLRISKLALFTDYVRPPQ